MNKDLLRQAAVIIAIIAVVAVNVLSQTQRWNGYTSGELTDQYFPLVLTVPAGYVFSIWGLIYLGLMAYAVGQGQPSQRENPRLRAIGWWFVLSCGANIAWLISFHWLQFTISLVFMLALLVCLIVIYIRLNSISTPPTRGERWFVHVPFSIYLGWITIATIANVSFVLFELGNRFSFLGLSAEIWTVILLAMAVLLAVLMLLRHGDLAYALVLVWALGGIYAKRVNSDFTLAATAGLVGAIAIAAAVILYSLTMVRKLNAEPAPSAS